MDKQINVWVVDDDRSIRWVLEKAFKNAGFLTSAFSSADGLIGMLKKEAPDVLLTDIRMPGKDGLTLLSELQELHPDLPVIIMTAHSDMESAVAAYDKGAFEYLPKPFDIDEVVSQVERAYRHKKASTPAVDDVSEQLAPSGIIGIAPAMQTVFRAIGRLSRSSLTVMVSGESGTGKELVAKALHKHSPRAAKPFIALNMAAIPRDLVESELFGHEKGAFTGAVSRRSGRFEQANGGTLFLDEIGDMPAEMQTRLLRVLADGEFYAVGGREAISVDVRVIAATHQGLEQLVEEGRFREDLFHRLNVVRIKIPPVRERREDIPLLLSYFLTQIAKELDVDAKSIKPEVVEYLSGLTWTGNVREIENTCRWLTAMCPGTDVHFEDLPSELKSASSSVVDSSQDTWLEGAKEDIGKRIEKGEEMLAKNVVSSIEKALILEALEATKGRRQEAAKLLGYGRNTLTRKIKELGL
jgi:two-component system nitrogen regulation response regulator GlnG